MYDPSGRQVWTDPDQQRANNDADALSARQTFGNNFSTHARSAAGNLYGTENTDLAANTPLTRQGNYDYLQAVSQRTNAETGGSNSIADIGNYQIGGNPNFVPQQSANAMAYGDAQAQRAAPQMNMNPQNMSLYNSSYGGNGAYGSAQQLGQVANGAGYQGQLGAASALMQLGQQAPGPSAAVLAMQQQGDQALQQQQALAAGARGGNAALALQNSAQNQAQISGQLNQNLGVQRAQEDLANRQFQANAIQGAGSVYGQAAGTQTGALSQQAGAYGQGANVFNNIGAQQAQQQQAQAQLQMQQQAQNDQQRLAYYQQAYGLNEDQATAMMNYDKQRTGNDITMYGIQKNAPVHPDMGAAVIGAGLTAAGAVAGTFVGGPAGTVAGASLGNAAGQAVGSAYENRK